MRIGYVRFYTEDNSDFTLTLQCQVSGEVYYQVAQNPLEENWQLANPDIASTPFPIHGSSICLRGNNNVCFRSDLSTDVNTPGILFENTTGSFIYSEGSLDDLLDYDEIEVPLTGELGQFCGLFAGNTLLRTPPEVSATQYGSGTYYRTFYNCVNLISAPELPVLQLDWGMYRSMFENCTSLKSAPYLPAKNLADGCYRDMFRNCISLTAPATFCNSGIYCNHLCFWRENNPFNGMFANCYNIILQENPNLASNACIKEWSLPFKNLSNMLAGLAEGTPEDFYKYLYRMFFTDLITLNDNSEVSAISSPDDMLIPNKVYYIKEADVHLIDFEKNKSLKVTISDNLPDIILMNSSEAERVIKVIPFDDGNNYGYKAVPDDYDPEEHGYYKNSDWPIYTPYGKIIRYTYPPS